MDTHFLSPWNQSSVYHYLLHFAKKSRATERLSTYIRLSLTVVLDGKSEVSIWKVPKVPRLLDLSTRCLRWRNLAPLAWGRLAWWYPTETRHHQHQHQFYSYELHRIFHKWNCSLPACTSYSGIRNSNTIALCAYCHQRPTPCDYEKLNLCTESSTGNWTQTHSNLNHLTFRHILYIQSVTGGTDQTSGGCSLCQTIPI